MTTMINGTLYLTCPGTHTRTLSAILDVLYPVAWITRHEADEQAMFALETPAPSQGELATLTRAVQQAPLAPVAWFWLNAEAEPIAIEEGAWHVL
jgi:hypothetical protein